MNEIAKLIAEIGRDLHRVAEILVDAGYSFDLEAMRARIGRLEAIAEADPAAPAKPQPAPGAPQ